MDNLTLIEKPLNTNNLLHNFDKSKMAKEWLKEAFKGPVILFLSLLNKSNKWGPTNHQVNLQKGLFTK